MSVDSVLDEALTILLAKAQRPVLDAPRTAPKPATLNFEFCGGGALPVPASCDPQKLTVPFPARVIRATMAAGNVLGAPVAVTAAIDVQVTRYETFGGSTPLYGTGTIPTITADSIHDCDLTGWNIDLDVGDWVIARLVSVTGTGATWVALDVWLRPLGEIGQSGVVDGSGNAVVDDFGNPVVA